MGANAEILFLACAIRVLIGAGQCAFRDRRGAGLLPRLAFHVPRLAFSCFGQFRRLAFSWSSFAEACSLSSTSQSDA